jgi:hypothetical protein
MGRTQGKGVIAMEKSMQGVGILLSVIFVLSLLAFSGIS